VRARRTAGSHPPAFLTMVIFREDELTPLLSIREAAKLLHISEDTLRRRVAAKKIAHRRIGSLVRFTMSDIQDFIERSKVGVAEPSQPDMVRLPPMTRVKMPPWPGR
jgi:excisionase family DNA binding protein